MKTRRTTDFERQRDELQRCENRQALVECAISCWAMRQSSTILVGRITSTAERDNIYTEHQNQIRLCPRPPRPDKNARSVPRSPLAADARALQVALLRLPFMTIREDVVQVNIACLAAAAMYRLVHTAALSLGGGGGWGGQCLHAVRGSWEGGWHQVGGWGRNSVGKGGGGLWWGCGVWCSVGRPGNGNVGKRQAA